MIYTMRPKGCGLTSGLQEFVNLLPSGITMVEIGCYAGEATQFFLQKAARVYCVDPWADYVEDNGDGKVVMTCMGEAEAAFDLVASASKGRIVKIKLPSIDAAEIFRDRMFDLVYIDGNHGYLDVLADIGAWKRTVKPGRILAGHDYTSTRSGVINAVDEILGRPDRVFDDYTWMKVIQ